MGRRTLFHITKDPAAILAAGFVNGDGAEGLGAGPLVGVLLQGQPALSSGQGLVLAVDFPAHVDLAEYEVRSGAGQWCVPAEVVNSTAEVRMLSQSEIDAAVAGRRPSR